MATLIKKEVPNNILHFPVVGIAVASGAINVLKKILSEIPKDSGTAYLVAHTLELPENLSEIISLNTQIPVHEIINDINLEPNHIYIMPENNALTTLDGVLKLKRSIRNDKQNNNLDLFFESLAEVYKNAAVGLMLFSDSNFKNVQGFKKIKESGGITIIQSSGKEAFRVMPQQIRDTDIADYVMKTDNFPFEMLPIQKSYLTTYNDEESIPQQEQELLVQIIDFISTNTKHDFRNYEQSIVRRHIAIRMAVSQKSTLESYFNFLKSNKIEQGILFNDFLITTTYFFRDQEYFKSLTEIVFPSLIKNSVDNNLRIWVAGCATGEEAYSLAICLHEYLLQNNLKDFKVQIFASDVSEKCIIKARSAIYSNLDVQKITEERLQNYFIKTNGQYHVKKVIRDMCIFAVHNFVNDPPFFRIDLISCRNVLKYFNPFLQNKALVSFYYSLKEKGMLFLGKSESANDTDDLFESIAKQEKIYIRKSILSTNISEPLLLKQNAVSTEKPKVQDVKMQEIDFQKIVSDILFSQYAPASVVINEHLDIVHFHGDISPFLSPSTGKPSFNILKMIDKEVGVQLQDAIIRVKKEKKDLRKDNILVKNKPYVVSFKIIVLENDDRHLMIIFYKDLLRNKKKNRILQKDQKKDFINGFEHNSSFIKKDMPHIPADKVKDTNSQAINEELENKIKELDSIKEELSCVSDELKVNQKELIKMLEYEQSIINTIHEPLIIIDKYFYVKTANPAFYKYFKTTENEIEGRSFFEIGNCQWNIPEFKDQISKVLDNNLTVENIKVETICDDIEKKVMLINACPIQNLNEGAILLTLNDITELVNANELLMVKKMEIKKYNSQLEAFTSAASEVLHEPLRKIHMFSKRTFENEKNISELGQHDLERIQFLILSMSNLVDDVISYSKVNFLEKEYKKTDLNKLFKKIIKDLKETISEKSAVISVSNLPVLNVIPQQIQQLFTNLILNSIIFSKEDKIPEIKIESQSPSKEEIVQIGGQPQVNYVKIAVSDNGIGFEKDYETRIFEPFYRLNLDCQYKGSGLGLTLAKKIISNHRGFIKSISEKNLGTTILMYIPSSLN